MNKYKAVKRELILIMLGLPYCRTEDRFVHDSVSVAAYILLVAIAVSTFSVRSTGYRAST